MPTAAPLYYGEGLYNSGEYIDAVSQGRETTAVNNAFRPVPPPIFTGMKLKEDVRLGNLVLNKIDANNVIWVCTEIDGWWVHPDPEVPDIPRGWGDGSYDVRGRWAARQITLSGTIMPPAPEYLPAARDALIQATSLVYSGAWLITEEDPARGCYVRLSGRPEITTVNARGKTEFTIGLRAADPVKYSWNSSDPDGYSSSTIHCKSTSGSYSGSGTVTNAGNTSVTAILEVTGPLTGPATIYNETTDELILIIGSLRDAVTKTVSNKALTSNVATITTSTAHTLAVDDVVTITGVDSTFNGEHVVTGIPTSTTFTFALTAANVSSTAASGTVARDVDILEIDTYEHEVAVNGIVAGNRSMVDTLVDWIKFSPGANTVQFTDEGNANSTASLKVYYRSGWIG